MDDISVLVSRTIRLEAQVAQLRSLVRAVIYTGSDLFTSGSTPGLALVTACEQALGLAHTSSPGVTLMRRIAYGVLDTYLTEQPDNVFDFRQMLSRPINVSDYP